MGNGENAVELDSTADEAGQSGKFSATAGEIIEYSGRKFGIFNCSVPISSYKASVPVLWEGGWKDFLALAEKSKIGTLYLYKDKCRGAIVGLEVGYFAGGKYHMMRVGETHAMDALLGRIVDRSSNPEVLRIVREMLDAPLEKLVDQAMAYIDSCYKDDINDRYDAREAVESFLESRGIPDASVSTALSIRAKKVADAVRGRILNRKLDKENELMPSLIMQCVEWARSQKLCRIYRFELRLFLRQINMKGLTDESQELLAMQVNNILR